MKNNAIKFIYKNVKLQLTNVLVKPKSNLAIKVLGDLKRDGISILPNHYDKSLIDGVCSTIPSLKDFLVSSEGDKSYYYPRASQIPSTRFFL